MAKKPVTEEPQVPEVRDTAPPTEPIEIELAPDEPLSTEVDLAEKPGTTPAPPKPEPEIKEPDDNPLQKALDGRTRAEELQRVAQRERDDAVRQARERDVELRRERGDREDAQYNSVLTAIAAEQSALDKAESDYAAAAAAGDWAVAGKAQRIIGTAAARLDRLEEGKQAFETKRESPKPETAPETRRNNEPLGFDQQLAALQVPDSAKSWLRNHPEFVTDATQVNKISAVHSYLTAVKGVAAFTPDYFDSLDEQLGFKAAPKEEPEPTPQTQRRSMPVSAPVSREVPTASGVRKQTTMNLTAEERLIARTSFTSDMTDAQKEYLYAQNKKKLHDMRANGQYRATTEENG